MTYVHLHGHSSYSLLEAIGSTKAIISRLKELGFSHAPMQDYAGMYNVIGHYQTCRKEGLTPIIGVDLPVQYVAVHKGIPRARYMTLIARNYTWYATLLQIISTAQTRNADQPHLVLSQFPECGGNIIVLLSAFETPLGDMIAQWHDMNALTSYVHNCLEIFGEGNVVLEVIPQNPDTNGPLADANLTLWKLYEALTQTNTAVHIPIIASSNFHYIYPDDKEARDIARCIKDGKRVYDDDRRVTLGEYHIMSADEITDQCLVNGFTQDQTNIMCENTGIIAEGIALEIPLGKLLFPIYESPAEIVELYGKFMEGEAQTP
jgi:DNA polymerase III subunit alpha